MAFGESKPLVDAALGKKAKRYPVWFMRQAGRYLPEYMQLRASHDFVSSCQTPQIAAEITLQPLRRFDLDGSIIFSDILIPCTAMGQTLTFDKGHGPRLSSPIRTSGDVMNLHQVNAEKDLGYVGEAIALTKSNLRPDQTMIGFAGAPFTVATYMIEGAGSKEFLEVKKLLYKSPQVLVNLLETISEVTVDYLLMQRRAGADIVMLFDTWAGQLMPAHYAEYIIPVMRKIITALNEAGVPVIYFPGQGSDRLPEAATLPCQVISVDWRTRMPQAIETLRSHGGRMAVQGNIDPLATLAPESIMRDMVRKICQDVREAKATGHIFNVGHGLTPHTPVEAIATIIDEVHKIDYTLGQ